MQRNKKIVCLGGGNAMPRVVLEGFKKQPVRLSVISATLDSGGSAGEEREYFNTKISFGDLRRAALALSDASAEDKARFAYRYKDGLLKNHVMANIYFTAGAVVADNFEKAMKELRKDIKEDLKIPQEHELLPATVEDATLCIELENGEIIRGEGNIDVPKHDRNLQIKRIFLEPEVKAYPEALKAIGEADLITIGPGDLFSSLAQILLVGGIPEAIRESRAQKAYICNLMTKCGETNNYSVLGFTGEIERFLGSALDCILYNNFFPLSEMVGEYKKGHPELLELVKVDENLPKDKFIGANLLKKDAVEHDPKIVSQILFSLL